MISFIISLVILIVGYIVYGRIIEKVFGIEPKRPTPAIANPDGIDYVQMPTWKCFLIQFLNIAGLGPVFGAIMGILYGQAAFLWIVFGTIFGGAVHDYFSGMISLRNNGASLPEIAGTQLGAPVKQFMRGFSLILMILVGAVFVSGPSELLCGLTENTLNVNIWIAIIFIYYILATLLPIDKLIGKIYPVFGFTLLFMALGILVALFANSAPIPEFTDGFKNYQKGNLPVFPMMFVSI
ncbi:MAG: carbon starvation protein A, partial [Bacteroidales bacterium]|nr:carbon starvation protein A [Bacteroidales bacterium]